MVNSGQKREFDFLENDGDNKPHDNVLNLSPFACASCKAKKLKCSKELPVCIACHQHDRQCRYDGQIIRSPLTRVHLTQVENRLQKLETIFSRLLPEIDIEEALTSLTSSQLSMQASVPRTSVPRTSVPRTSVTSTSVPSTSVREDQESEALPEDAEGFEWKEDATDLDHEADGMAALSVLPSGTGYFGSTSSAVFLRSILPWMTGVPISRTSHYEPMGPTQALDRPLTSHGILDQAQSHQLATHLIDSYFAQYHTLYPFVHEATFRAQYSGLVRRPVKHAWDMLLNSILAMGAWCNGTDSDGIFYEKALSGWQNRSILDSGSLALLQALLLLSNLTQKLNKPNTGWNFIGLAVRMAVGLGLHRELPKWRISLLEREIRRRVWWALFILDSGASKTFGRVVLLPDTDAMDVNPVSNIPDELLTPLTNENPQEVDEPTLYSGLIAQAGFHVAANKILKRLLSSTGVLAGEALSLNVGLSRWLESLPWYCHLDRSLSSSTTGYLFARSHLWWKYWNLQITLTRPFLLQWMSRRFESIDNLENNQEIMECQSLCISSSHRTIVSISDFVHQNSLSRVASWYSLYFIFQAALVTAVCLRADPAASDAPMWREDLGIARDALGSKFPMNNLANRCLELLDVVSSDRDESWLLSESKLSAEANEAFCDFNFWSETGAESLNILEWPFFGDQFG